MTALAPRNAMLAKVHIAKKQLGLDDDLYRDALMTAVGKASAADCSDAELGRVIKHFGSKGFHVKRPGERLPGYAESKYGPKILALWISGWNLGIIRDRSDVAMEAFIERQTGIASVRWLKAAEDASKVVEGLKKWLAREGNVDWGQPGSYAPAYADYPGYRIAVAQWLKLIALGEVRVGKTWTGCDAAPTERLFAYGKNVLSKHNVHEWTPGDWVTVNKALGRKLRATIERKERGE